MIDLAAISAIPLKPKCPRSLTEREAIAVTVAYMAAIERGWSKDEAHELSVAPYGWPDR